MEICSSEVKKNEWSLSLTLEVLGSGFQAKIAQRTATTLKSTTTLCLLSLLRKRTRLHKLTMVQDKSEAIFHKISFALIYQILHAYGVSTYYPFMKQKIWVDWKQMEFLGSLLPLPIPKFIFSWTLFSTTKWLIRRFFLSLLPKPLRALL